MSFVELSNVMFRGTLKAARGSARFKLTANAINAVDSININFNQVTYNRFMTYSRPSQAAGSTLATMTLDVPDTAAWVEIIAYGDHAGSVLVDEVVRPNRNRRSPNSQLLPFVEIVHLTKGTHTVVLRSSAAGSSKGLIMCRYVRDTGA